MTVYFYGNDIDKWEKICKDAEEGKVPKIILRGIEYALVRHGKWMWVEDVPLKDGETEYDRESFYRCSECGAYDVRLKDCHADYCWSCGARMDCEP